MIFWMFASMLLVALPCVFEKKLTIVEKIAMFLFAPGLLFWYIVAFIRNGRWPHKDIFQ